ncbi:unnamed protein product, partial [Vitis vinifera]
MKNSLFLYCPVLLLSFIHEIFRLVKRLFLLLLPSIVSWFSYQLNEGFIVSLPMIVVGIPWGSN